jgi:prevent-host-death family protein
MVVQMPKRKGIIMRSVNVADLKNNLSRYLNQVKQGEEVLIKDRNKPIAKIIPLSASDDEEAEILALAAEGKIKLAETEDGLPDDFWSLPAPKVSVDTARLIREERDER